MLESKDKLVLLGRIELLAQPLYLRHLCLPKKARKMNIKTALFIVAFTCLMASPALSQDNVYGGYSDERKTEEAATPSILMQMNADQKKTLADYSSCPAMKSECALCTPDRCDDMPAPPCASHMSEFGKIADITYLFVHFKIDTSAQEESKENAPYSICESDESGWILEKTNNGSIIPILQLPPERNGIDVQLHDAKGRSVLAISRCSIGTGGCVDELYILSEKKTWMPLQRDESWNALYDNLPKNYQPHKTVPIDFKTMHWDRAISTDNDANCCPSGEISIDLSIQKDQLHVEKYEYETGIKY